jgi:hypothetical protein
MRIAGIILKAIGWIVFLVPLTIFLGLLAYAYVMEPGDTSGWGALIGAFLILNVATAPVGLLVLLLGYAFRGPKREGKFAGPPS